MTRALSLICLALLLVGSAAPHSRKPIDRSPRSRGRRSERHTDRAGHAGREGAHRRSARVARRPAPGQYQLAPGSDKELIDQKLLNNCDNEAPGCMSAIGNQLGADVLMYGQHPEGRASQYQVTIKVLDVGRKAMLKTSTDLIPVAEAQRRAAAGLGEEDLRASSPASSSGGTLVVKLSNADRGTILIDGEEKGNITSGTGTVAVSPRASTSSPSSPKASAAGRRTSRSPRRHGDDSRRAREGRRSDRSTVTGGPVRSLAPVLVPAPAAGGRHAWLEGRSSASAVVAIGGGGGWCSYDNYKKFDDVDDEQCRMVVRPRRQHRRRACRRHDDAAETRRGSTSSNDEGDDRTQTSDLGVGDRVASARSCRGVRVLQGASVAKKLVDRSTRARGKRVSARPPSSSRRSSSPDGGGATLRLDW